MFFSFLGVANRERDGKLYALFAPRQYPLSQQQRLQGGGRLRQRIFGAGTSVMRICDASS
jgi:hypothetical protein